MSDQITTMRVGAPAGPRYSPLARTLHWLTAGCIAIAVPLAFGMNNLPDGKLQDAFYANHESFGLLIWLVAVLRLITRAVSPPPAAVDTLTGFQLLASRITHTLMYGLIFLLPILGFVGIGLYPAGANFFGFDLPNPIPASWHSESNSDAVLTIHQFGAYALLAVVAVHIGAALYHRHVKNDGVMPRMLDIT